MHGIWDLDVSFDYCIILFRFMFLLISLRLFPRLLNVLTLLLTVGVPTGRDCVVNEKDGLARRFAK